MSSKPSLRGVRRHGGPSGGDPRAQFVVGDAIASTSRGTDVIVSGLVINFLSDPYEALQAWRSNAARGTVAYVWDYAEGMQMLRYFWDAAVELDSTATAKTKPTDSRCAGPTDSKTFGAEPGSRT